MRTWERMNPIAAAVYFAAVAGTVMFGADPLRAALSLAGGAAMFVLAGGERRFHLLCALVFAAGTLLNPLISRRGTTVLFVLNNDPVTLEAVAYGAASSASIAAVMYWFGCFSAVMTTDKLLYIFGSALPRLSLILSMALRYVPLFARKARETDNAQRAMGLCRDEGFVDTLRAKLRVLSVMVTWTLENGIITADSMEARGYGSSRRSFFALYRFTGSDAAVILISVALAAISLAGRSAFTIYPALSAEVPPPFSIISYCAYALLAALPSIIRTGDEVRWRYLRSRL